jgi:hypothetical protein
MSIPTDPSGQPTFLQRVREALYDAAGQFSDFANRLERIPVIGAYPAAACRDAASFLRKAGISLYDFEQHWKAVRDFAKSLEDRWGLDNLIRGIWSEWFDFRANTRNWLSIKLSQLLSTWSELKSDAALWVRHRLQSFWSDAENLIRDPASWVRERLRSFWGEAETLIRDPRAWLAGKLQQHWPELYSFATDSTTWVKTKLAGFLGVPYSFWADPWGYMYDRFLTLLEQKAQAEKERLQRLGERLLRLLWEGVW